MNIVDLAVVEKIIVEVAAAEIMPRFRKLEQGDIDMKGVDDPVTVADKAAEKALIARLTELLPGSVVVGEEGCSENLGIMSHFDGDDYVWVIDPIDGTNNFIQGRREFGVIVALVKNGETVAAWIHDPNTGHTLMGEKGGGVWLQGKKMSLAGQDSALTKILIIGSRVIKALTEPIFAPIAAALPALEKGSASAFDYGRLFTGDVLFGNSAKPRASFLLFRLTNPWDHMAGLFLHAEAGGHSADFDGHAYDPKNTENGILVAPDKASWLKLYDILKPVIGDLNPAKNKDRRTGPLGSLKR